MVPRIMTALDLGYHKNLDKMYTSLRDMVGKIIHNRLLLSPVRGKVSCRCVSVVYRNIQRGFLQFEFEEGYIKLNWYLDHFTAEPGQCRLCFLPTTCFSAKRTECEFQVEISMYI